MVACYPVVNAPWAERRTPQSEIISVNRAAIEGIVRGNPALLDAMTMVVAERRSQLQEAIRETGEVAARNDNQALLKRVRAFFGL